MTMYRELLVLTQDIKNTDTRPRTGPFRGMPDEYCEGELFVHCQISPDNGAHRDFVMGIDDDDEITYVFEADSPMYRKVLKASRRARPSIARLLHEYDAYAPQTVATLLRRLVESEVITLQQLEDVVKQHRREMDYDMLDEADVIALPQAGRSKLDADSGRTDPRKNNYDPDLDGYHAPPGDEVDEDDEPDEPDEPDEGETTGENITVQLPGSSKPTQLQALANQVFDVLAQTPGKTRRLKTLAKLVDHESTNDICLAMDLLYRQKRINDKGHAVIKENK